MKQQKTYIANWKMNFTLEQTLQFTGSYYDQLISKFSAQKSLVLCPSFEALFPLSKLFATTSVSIGAQDCSAHLKGNFTGQVSAASIKNLGANHCIIGHSERRKYNNETNDEIWKKFELLIQQHINPILCFGETLEQNEQGQTFTVLEKQLEYLLSNKPVLPAGLKVYLAYEPVWAIGTGKTPTSDQLETTFAWLNTKIVNLYNNNQIHLIYGGSVSSRNIDCLGKVPKIDGFLIGGASLDYEELEKIINYPSL